MKRVITITAAGILIICSCLNAQTPDKLIDRYDCITCHKSGIPSPGKLPDLNFNDQSKPAKHIPIVRNPENPKKAITSSVFSRIGPEGGNTQNIIKHKNGNLYALVKKSIHKSTDDGNTWNTIRYYSSNIEAIAVDPDKIYHANSSYFFKSSDGGENWEYVIINNEYNITFKGLYVDPNDPQTILGFGHYFDYQLYKHGICFVKSNDGGENWSFSSVAINSSASFNFDQNMWAVNPSNSQNIIISGYQYSGGYLQYLFRSTDGGENWIDTNFESKIAVSDYSFISCLDLNTKGELSILLRGTGIYSSSNLGDSWTFKSSNPSYGYTLTYMESSPDILVCGYYNVIYKSADGGSSWTDYSIGIGGGPVNSLLLRSETEYLIANYSGIYKSNDGGTIWESSCSGINCAEIRGIDVSESNPDVIYTGVYLDGVYKSTDRGKTWNRVLSLINISSVAVDKSDHNIAYAIESG